MDLFLQFGYGMMGITRELLSLWGGGTVVLSPRDLTPRQLLSFSDSLHKISNTKILLDPQFYLPHSNHKTLISHSYWPKGYSTGTFWSGNDLIKLLSEIININEQIGADEVILPGLYAEKVTDEWLEQEKSTLDEFNKLQPAKNSIVTIALGPDAVKSDEQIHTILDHLDSWETNAFYIVCAHPNGHYLVDEPIWISNVMDLISGIRLKRKKAILGYSNHQMLITACSGASSICSGTWLNVRAFPPEKFKLPDEEDKKQRTTWYYCPQALSEFQIPFLDVAFRLNILNLLIPDPGLNSNYANNLFSGLQPTAVGFDEPASFRHYLQCLREQTKISKKDTYDLTIQNQNAILDIAEILLQQLHTSNIKGSYKDFFDVIEVNRAALTLFNNSRAPLMRRNWNNI
jgi:hypothetical protein